MTFTHDVEHSLAAVVDLVNTDPAAGGHELLPDVDALNSFVKEYEVSGVGELTEKDLEAVRAIRPRLRDVFLAPSQEAAA